MFAARKLESLNYRMASIAWLYVYPFWWNTGLWRTDRQTDRHGIYYARMARRGNNRACHRVVQNKRKVGIQEKSINQVCQYEKSAWSSGDESCRRLTIPTLRDESMHRGVWRFRRFARQRRDSKSAVLSSWWSDTSGRIGCRSCWLKPGSFTSNSYGGASTATRSYSLLLGILILNVHYTASIWRAFSFVCPTDLI